MKPNYIPLILGVYLLTALFAAGCARSVKVNLPPKCDTANCQTVVGPVPVEVEFHSRADQSTFSATVRPNGSPIGGSNEQVLPAFTINGNQGMGSWTPPVLSAGDYNYTLRVSASMSPRRAGDSTAHDHAFRLRVAPPPPPPPPVAVNALSPTSGIVGTEVSVSGVGFSSTHTVNFGGRNVATSFINATEVRFRVPQRVTGSHTVAVSGVGALPFTLNAAAFTPAPTPINLDFGDSETINVTLPLPAPPGGVRLDAAASIAGMLQIGSNGRFNYSTNASADSIVVTATDLGSGSLNITGNGYSSTSIPLTVSIGTPVCGVRARTQGGVEFVSPPGSNTVVGSLPSTSAPGRIATAPGGARAVAQYLTGISFIDLVNCSSLGTFQNSTIPLLRFAFSSNGRYFAADWIHNTQNDGLVAYDLLDGRRIFSRNTTSNSQAVQIAGDATGTYAFWVTSTNTPQGAQPGLGIHGLSNTTQCFVGNVPNTVIGINMSGGNATLTFAGQPPAWVVRASNCSRIQ